MSDLPLLQSYADPKKQKAYERYILDGDSQRTIASALKITSRTVANWSSADGWEAERQARRVGAEVGPNVSAAAAAARNDSEAPPRESRAVGMDKMLERQQRIAGLLVGAFEEDVENAFDQAEKAGKTGLTRAQLAQLTMLGNNVLALERKAWCVPDKIETKDTTPTPADPVRNLTDEELDRRERELDDLIAAAEGREIADQGGEAPPSGVN
jgi:hypothetical protein